MTVNRLSPEQIAARRPVRRRLPPSERGLTVAQAVERANRELVRAARPPEPSAPPRLDVAVSHPAGRGSAIARPRRSSYAPTPASAPARRLSGREVLDLLVRGLWAMRIASGAPVSWDDEVWRRADFDPAALLDETARALEEEALPYPGSPRLDGVGGGRRVAEDGSPGVPAAWLRYLTREERHSAATRPLALEQGMAWLLDRYTKEWRAYREHVLRGLPAGVVAQAQGCSIKTVYVRCARARGALLAYIAEYMGEGSAAQMEEALALLPPVEGETR